MAMFLVFSSTWWWIASVLFLIVLIYSSITENGFILTINYIVYILLLQFLIGVPIFQSIIHNPLKVLIYTGIYLCAGTVWSIFKYYKRVSDYVKKSIEQKKTFCEKNKIENINALKGDLFHEYKTILKNIQEYKPAIKQSKADVSYWIAYWPISVVVYFFEDFLKNLLDNIIDMFGGVYRSIENKLYKKLDGN